MAKLQSFASLSTQTDVDRSPERETHPWTAGFKAAASMVRGAVRDAGLGPVPKRAKAYYFGVADVSRTTRDEEQCAELREIEASLLKALASELSSDASARLLILLEEVRIRLREVRR